MARTTPIDPHFIFEVFAGSQDHAIVPLGADGTIQGWLGAASKLFGHSENEAVGQPFGMIFVEEDLAMHLHDHEMAVAATSGRSEDDRWHVRKGGSRFWGSGILQARFDDARNVVGYCKIVRDRSDLRTRSEAQANEIERLSDLLRRREEFLVSMVHELRNPLNPLSAAIEILGVSKDEVAKSKAVQVLKRQAGVLKRQLDDLRDASIDVIEKISVNVDSVVVNDALDWIVTGEMPVAERKGLELRLVLPAGTIVVEADPHRLQQMVQNLLSNAIKYTPPGGRIVVSATVEATDVSIRVEDNGIGIEPEVLPRMFRLFAREEQPASSPAEGLGVGLAIVKALADLHGGTIEGRSPGRNRGSVFTLRLPLRQPPSALRKQQGAT